MLSWNASAGWEQGTERHPYQDLSPVILPLASEGGCQFTIMVLGFPSLLTTVTSFGGEVGTTKQQHFQQSLSTATQFTISSPFPSASYNKGVEEEASCLRGLRWFKISSLILYQACVHTCLTQSQKKNHSKDTDWWLGWASGHVVRQAWYRRCLLG